MRLKFGARGTFFCVEASKKRGLLKATTGERLPGRFQTYMSTLTGFGTKAIVPLIVGQTVGS